MHLTAGPGMQRGQKPVPQQDGAPNYFGAFDAARATSERGGFNDWRTVTIPPDADPTGEWQLAIGLDDPATGLRATAADGAQTALILPLSVGRAVPDQACALNAAACASQPQIYPR